MNASCARNDCTLAETNKCLLNNDPQTCEHRLTAETLIKNLGAPVLPTPAQAPVLRPSLTLGTEEIGKLFNRTSCIMVGILGLPDAGKTAALVSLYLQLSNRQLKNFDYRHSESLSAFEQLSRGLRNWKRDALPEKLTAHTVIADGRSPAFLHLRAYCEDQDRLVDLLLPDLPGEWTADFANLNRGDRFEFLASCAEIWIFVDGRKLKNLETRNGTLRTLDITVRRISSLLGESTPALKIVSTWADAADIDESWLQEILDKTRANGRQLSLVKVASFSDSDLVPPGTGIASLVEGLLCSRPDEAAYSEPARQTSRRAIMNFRG